MARVPRPARKRRTREHVMADPSINHVERHALLCGFALERRIHDYGIDLVLLTYNARGEEEPGEVLLQLKATDRVRTVRDGRFVSVRIERAHLRAWLLEPMPMILIVYDARTERAFWLYVQAAFPGVLRFRAEQGSETLTLRIPIAQVLDKIAMRSFRKFQRIVIETIRGALS